MIVGFEKGYYPEKRCIIDKVDSVDYKDITLTNPIQFLHRVQRKLSINLFEFNLFRYRPLFSPKVDLIHFFNTISYASMPWISTFESFLPRFQELYTYHHGENRKITNHKKVEKALKQIASDHCKKIIALSECSKNIQLDFLGNFPEYLEPIADKLEVIHPPQPLLIDSVEQKNYSGNKLTFIFLGGSFHRKGGPEIYRVFNKLRKKYDFNLIIISRFLKENYATFETDSDINQMRELISSSDWIEYHSFLPNPEAMELLKRCHVALLPTWADSYGYTLLEFQAAGCPVISTNVRAMPEINNDSVGWMIDIPKNNLGRPYTPLRNKGH